jgi:hypothetical protein
MLSLHRPFSAAPLADNANRGSIYHLDLPPANEARLRALINGGVIGLIRAGRRWLSAPALSSPRS